MASIHRVRNEATGLERWRVMCRIDGRQYGDTFLTERAAIRHKDRIDRLGAKAARALLDMEDVTGRATLTLAQQARAYVERLDGITAGTRRDYLSMISRRLDGTDFGDLPLELVTRDAASAWLRDLETTGLSAKTRRNHHALVSAAMTDAVERDLIPANRVKGVRIKAETASRDKMFLTPGEVAVLVAAVPAHYQPFVVFLVGTGMRFGEATAVQVGDVDLDGQVALVHVRRAWKRTGKAAKTLGTTKTSAGERTVSLPPEVVTEIRPLIEGRRRDELLFTAPGGGVIRNDHFHARVWGPTLDKLNATIDRDGNKITPRLSGRPRVHDLRHTHASQMIRAGVGLEQVQRRLGHESISTTVGVYGHLAPDYLATTAIAASLGLRQAVPEIEA